MLLAREPGKLGLGAQSQLHILAHLLSHLLGLHRVGAGDLGSDDNVRLALDGPNVALVDESEVRISITCPSGTPRNATGAPTSSPATDSSK